MNTELLNVFDSKQQVLILTGTFRRNPNTLGCSACIDSLDPYVFHNVHKAHLQDLFNGMDEIKNDHTTQLVGFPLVMSIGLLDNQNIALVTCKPWCSVAVDINGGGGVEQPRISIGQVASCASVKFFRSNAKAVFLPLQRHV
jgi:hypothetical protein